MTGPSVLKLISETLRAVAANYSSLLLLSLLSSSDCPELLPNDED
jgi:hypothetical protein